MVSEKQRKSTHIPQVNLQNMIREPTKPSSSSYSNMFPFPRLANICISKSRVEPSIVRKHTNKQDRSVRKSESVYQDVPSKRVRFQEIKIYQSNLDVANGSDHIQNPQNAIPILHEDDEFIQHMKIALMRTKIAIDNCTYEESRPRFQYYTIVPFIDIFH